MANNEMRSSLRGSESAIFDLVYTTATKEQWAEWLRVPLQHAAAVSDLGLVKKLQRAGDADACAFYAAVEGGHAAVVRYLVKRGASVTKEKWNRDSPLHLAAAQGDEETVSFLLGKGAPPNALGSGNRTPLQVAAENGHLAALNAILAAGANASYRYAADSAMDLAAAEGHMEIVSALIRSGENVNVADPRGCTALHKAASMGEEGVIDVLVKAGASVNGVKDKYFGSSPLHCASVKCRVEAILALVKHGAWVDDLNNHGRTPLHSAAAQGHLLAVKALLASSADANAADSAGRTALHMAANNGHEDVSRVLVQAGTDVNATSSRGDTALHDAFGGDNDAGTVRVLIEAGATVDARNGAGKTPLLLWLHTKILWDGWGVPVNAGFNIEPMAILLEGGANANAEDPSGNFPLHLVSTLGLSEKDAGNVVDLLLRWGADETAVNEDGKTPLEDVEANVEHDYSGRLRDLLTQAPVDRNWRRRGWLLLYRAYPRRMRPIPGTGAAPSDRAKRCRARSVTEAAGGASVVRVRAEGAVGGGGVGAPGDWSGVVTWVVGLELEGVFRNVVQYL